ncbi:MAG: ribosome maturation factor RimM [Finegoldia sp.]|nr:ribosome maturation factor RimM [Finegoldia sp.]
MEYIAVGKVLNTHGIKGTLKLMPLTDNIERFADTDTLYYLGDKKKEVTIEKYRFQKGFLYLDFKEFDNINQVLIYKNQYLYIDKKDRFELTDEDVFYVDDIIGLKVYEKGNYLGDLVEVIPLNGNDVYKISNGDREMLIPAVKEFIKEIKLEEGTMEVVTIEGM